MKFIFKGIVIVLFCLLVACSKVTQENFDKIKTGMTMQEVVAILGEPTTSEVIDVGGLSGATATWKDKDRVISIQFLGDKVQVKTMSHEK